ncbi:hypothetical protein NVP1103O_58 [Vibrio phage 1.103.O._10N.261.52.F2]|nr:hypothetical protein NVP1103O_58 [Vibrio phage 1.103.O._10N.261.52.F2]
MLTAVNLEQLILARHKTWKDGAPISDTDARVTSVYVQGDEVRYTLEYGYSYLYRDDFLVSYTELLLWYINQRTGA